MPSYQPPKITQAKQQELLEAVRTGNFKSVAGQLNTTPKRLHGPLLLAKDYVGQDALTIALQQEHTKIAKLLIDYGAPVNPMSQRCNSPLLTAAWLGQTDMCDYLIAHGARLDHCDCTGTTALHFAACYNHPKTLQLLLAKGANLVARDDKQNTPLMIAAKKMLEPIVHILLEQYLQRGILVTPAEKQSMLRLPLSIFTMAEQVNHNIIANYVHSVFAHQSVIHQYLTCTGPSYAHPHTPYPTPAMAHNALTGFDMSQRLLHTLLYRLEHFNQPAAQNPLHTTESTPPAKTATTTTHLTKPAKKSRPKQKPKR